MLERLIHCCTRGLPVGYLPCHVVRRDPLIIISYWFDFFANRERFMATLAKHSRVFLLFQLGWHRETDERAAEIETAVAELKRRHAGLDITFLCNSPTEESQLVKRGVHGILCHQNAFLDEHRYQVMPHVRKKYDAIYVARITPFKRHELAGQVMSLRLVGDYSSAEEEHFRHVMALLPHADWRKRVASRDISRVMNTARAGLCLSAEEGAMFVSAEYLLCGLPVVSTRNRGGRDTVFPADFALTVEDDPLAVANGVTAMIGRNIDPRQVRAAILSKLQPHRKVFVDLLNRITGEQKEFHQRWQEVFIHKMGLRCRRPFHIRFRHGLK